MNALFNRGTLLQRVLILLLAILLPVVLFVALRSSPPGVMVMPVPYEISKPKTPWLQGLSGPIGPWWWRFKSRVLGPPRVITLDAAVIECKDPALSLLTKQAVGEAEFADTNGLRVWRLGTNEVKALRRQLERTPGNAQLFRPRVTTASGVQARLFTGNTIPVDGIPHSVGLVADFLPRVRRDSTDLTTVITLTSAWTNQPIATSTTTQTNTVSLRTNFAVAARIQIPNGRGVFLLKSSQQDPNERSTAILISTTPQ